VGVAYKRETTVHVTNCFDKTESRNFICEKLLYTDTKKLCFLNLISSNISDNRLTSENKKIFVCSHRFIFYYELSSKT